MSKKVQILIKQNLVQIKEKKEKSNKIHLEFKVKLEIPKKVSLVKKKI